MVSSMAVTAAYAHSPSSVSVTAVTATTVTIGWTHSGAAGCATSDSGSSCLTDVDIMRIPGQNTSGSGSDGDNYSVLVGNSTAHVVANNATGLSSWQDHSLPEGTLFNYQVCHNEADAVACTTALTDGTNEGNSDKVWTTTKASEISGLTMSADQNSVVLTWQGFVVNGTDNGGGASTASSSPGDGVTLANDTAVAGYKIEYSSDGGSTFTTSTSNSSSTTRTYEVTGLQSSVEYVFRVSGVTDPNSFAGNAGTTSLWTGITRGEESDKVFAPPQATSYSNGVITDGNLQVTVKENKGWDRTLNVALYTNITEDQTKQDSDTYIIWNYFDPVHVSDPHGYFDNVNVVTAQSGVRTMDVTYEITWNKSLAKSDVILETTNFQSQVGTTIVKEAWKSFPATQISYETPEETPKKTIMTLFDGGVMNHLLLNNNIDHTLLSAVDYFVYDEIIDVSQDVVVLQQEQGVVQLFEKITLSQDNVKVGHKYLKTLVISGTLKDEFHQIGEPVTFYISSPDGTDSEITAVTTSARTFKVPIILDEFESGIYQFQPSHKGLLGEPFSFKH